MNKPEADTVHKKCQQSKTPEPSQSQKHCRQQQQDQTKGLITEMLEVTRTPCSSIQPALVPPQQQKADVIKLMEADRDFEKSDSIPVIRLFTSSIDIADSYLTIRDKEVRTMYLKDSLS